MVRPEKPSFLLEWEAWIKAGPPKCCHTCDHFGGAGQCFEFDMVPPIDFVNSQGKCDQWSREIPF